MPSTNSSPPPKPPYISAFDVEIALLLEPKNPQARSLLAFTRRTLYQYQLNGRFSEIDIFIRAYLRGIEQMLAPSGQPIKKPKAWIRATIHNIIREESRACRKFIPLDDDYPDEEAFADSSRIEFCLKAVVLAYQRLDHDNRKLIELRFFQGRSWKGVHEKIGEHNLEMSALRKRGQRALEKLRQEYHRIVPHED